ncbi:TetR/AcrR family transcriptional regulator [Klebsiella michiganensis]|uniref:TetR/AcrR family transcriptional regulator n=1 Tax=Klebsiella TaxID=570 RepID=UPI003919FCE8
MNGNNQSEKRVGRPRTQDSATRRQIVLDAAYHAFIEYGFARTTTSDIAARAGISKRAIYDVFSNKTELFTAVIHEHRHLLLDLPRPESEELSVLETLTQIFRLDIDSNDQAAREAILRLLTRESVLFPELSEYLYQKEILRSREALIEWLLYEISRGRLPSGDVLVYAGMLMDIVFGALIPRRVLLTDTEREQRTEHIRQRLAIFLRGIGC